MKDTRYLVIHRRENGEGDAFIEVYETLAAANDAAETAWNHLTDREKKSSSVQVGIVTTEELTDWAVDEDGNIDWCAFTGYHHTSECFDSKRYEAYAEKNVYGYEELAEAALSADATQEDIDALGEWFESYGIDYWTGECYKVDSNHCLYPIHREIGEDEYEVVGYELR